VSKAVRVRLRVQHVDLLPSLALCSVVHVANHRVHRSAQSRHELRLCSRASGQAGQPASCSASITRRSESHPRWQQASTTERKTSGRSAMISASLIVPSKSFWEMRCSDTRQRCGSRGKVKRVRFSERRQVYNSENNQSSSTQFDQPRSAREHRQRSTAAPANPFPPLPAFSGCFAFLFFFSFLADLLVQPPSSS
jgi:hypothetical protein